MIRVCFLMRQLNVGGAQRQVIELATGLDKSTYAVTVVTFYSGGQLSPEVAAVPGVELLSMNKRGRWDVIPFFVRLVATMRALRPDVLHGYLGVPNLLCVATKPFLKKTRVVWGVRASYKDLKRYDWLTSLTFGLERLSSRFPDLIIANSEAGKEFYASQGFPASKMVVVANGIDTERFRPDPEAGKGLRGQWGLGVSDLVIGLVGRLDPRKDHVTFLQAAAILSRERSNARFVCVGDGPTAYKKELRELGDSLGLKDRLLWTGARSDMASVYNALDILSSSSSFGEGFPNVVGEAMACGVPCVVTDVGDSRKVVGETGIVVMPGDPSRLAEAWKELLDLPESQRALLGEKARTRIVDEFRRDLLVQRTTEALARLL